MAAPTSAIHLDEEIYSNPEQFDGFRFWKPSDSDGGVAEKKCQAAGTSPEYLAFGFGRHAW